MLEPTRKPITNDYVELRFLIPKGKLAEAKKALSVIGAEEVLEESVSWEEVYPEFNPGVALRGARKREALTQKELARLTRLSQTHISEMEHGKRSIGKEVAKRLAKVLRVNYRVFL